MLLLLGAVAAYVQFPYRDAFFVVDDVPWLNGVGQVWLGGLDLFAFILVPSREQLLPLWRLQYYTQWRIFGLEPVPWHLVAGGAHVVAGLCLYSLFHHYGARRSAAVLGAVSWAGMASYAALNPFTHIACHVYPLWVMWFLLAMVSVTKAHEDHSRRYALAMAFAASASVATFGPALVCVPALLLQYLWLERKHLADPAKDRIWIKVWGICFAFWTSLQLLMMVLVGFDDPAQRVQSLGVGFLRRLVLHYKEAAEHVFFAETSGPHSALLLLLSAAGMLGLRYGAPRLRALFAVLFFASLSLILPVLGTRDPANDFAARYTYFLVLPISALVAVIMDALASSRHRFVRLAYALAALLFLVYWIPLQHANAVVNRKAFARVYVDVINAYDGMHALLVALSQEAQKEGKIYRLPDVPLRMPMYSHQPPTNFCQSLASMYAIFFPNGLPGLTIVPFDSLDDDEIAAADKILLSIGTPTAGQVSRSLRAIGPDLNGLQGLSAVAGRHKRNLDLPDAQLAYPRLGIYFTLSQARDLFSDRLPNLTFEADRPAEPTRIAQLRSQVAEDKALIAFVERRLTSSPARQHYAHGLSHAEHTQWDEALAEFNKAMELDPADDDALFARANVWISRGLPPSERLDEVAEHLSDALGKEPENSELRLMLADVLMHQGRADQAMAHLREGLIHAADLPTRTALNMRLVEILQEADRFEEAIQEMQNVVASGEVSASLRHRLGTLQLAVGDVESAKKNLQSIKGHDDEYGGTLVALGCVAQIQRNLEEAQSYFKQALEVPLSPEQQQQALERLETTRNQIDLLHDAETTLRQALESNPMAIDVKLQLLQVLLQQRRLDEAEQMYATLKNEYPDVPMLHVIGADLFLTRNQPAAAIGELEAAIRLLPSDGRLRLQLAVILNAQGRGAEAIAQLREAAQRDQGNLDAMSYLAWMLATHPNDSLRSGDQALSLANAVCLQSGQDVATYWDTLAAAQAEAGRFQDAVRSMRRAIAALPAAVDKRELRRYQQRMTIYEQGKPFRDPSLGIKRPTPKG